MSLRRRILEITGHLPLTLIDAPLYSLLISYQKSNGF